jgi:hypothetical protein
LNLGKIRNQERPFEQKQSILQLPSTVLHSWLLHSIVPNGYDLSNYLNLLKKNKLRKGILFLRQRHCLVRECELEIVIKSNRCDIK